MVVLNTESSSYRNSGALYIGMDISISGQSSSSDVAVRTERGAREEESELIFYGRASDNKACYFIFIFNTDFGASFV